MQTTSGDQHEKFLHLIALGTTPIKPNVAQTTQVGSPDRLVKHANYFFSVLYFATRYPVETSWPIFTIYASGDALSVKEVSFHI
jgi:hypothetical protein